MLTAYGHVKIEWGDKVFNLSPSFVNIAKLGTPTEIIETFKDFIGATNLIMKFSIALNVLKCCSDIEIPERLTGGVKYSERLGKFMIVNPAHGEAMISDVITLAEHCFIHGVCGKVPEDEQPNTGKQIKEFDAYAFMELARVHLELSLSDASQMTMTEFIRMMNIKFPPDKDKPTLKEERDMVAWFYENNEVH